MGTTCISDSITQQKIRENEQVISFILTDAASEYSPPRLLTDSVAGSYKFATLPVKGTWDGNHVIPSDSEEITRFNSALFLGKQDKEMDYIELQNFLHNHYSQEEDNKNRSYQLMVIKESTHEKVMSQIDFDRWKVQPSSSLNLERSNKIIEKILELLSKADDKNEQSDTFDARFLARIAGFEISHELLGLKPSFTSNAFTASNESCFTKSMWRLGLEYNLIGDSLWQYLLKNREKPKHYDVFHNAIFQSKILKFGMDNLDIPLSPSYRIRDWGLSLKKQKFNLSILKEDLMGQLRYCSEHNYTTAKDELNMFIKEISAITKLS